MSRFFTFLTICTIFLFSATYSSSAQACPMCKTAAEQDERQPKAYMYSILFMLGMPTMIFGTIGVGLYRMNKRETEFDPLPPLENGPPAE